MPAAACLVLKMDYPSAPGEAPLPRAVTEYHERVEDGFLGLADGRRVRPGVSSAGPVVGRGREWWTEAMGLTARSADHLGPVAERAVRLVRRLGIRAGHRFTLRLRAADAGGDWREWVRRVYRVRDTAWRRARVATRLGPRGRGGPPFPGRLDYLSGWARRCMGVGGNDVYGLFANPTHLQTFLAGLQPEDRAGLADLYRRIVRRKDNEWLLGWLRADPDGDDGPPAWAVQAHWLMTLLDRLREAGLFDRPGGRARRPELVFWDDYLMGEPG
jgi:hypothetical protein